MRQILNAALIAFLLSLVGAHASAAVPESVQVKAVARAYRRAELSGDLEAVKRLSFNGDAEAREAHCAMNAGLRAADKAAMGKWGEGVTSKNPDNVDLTFLEMIDAATPRVVRDKAIIVIDPEQRLPNMHLQKIDGQWKVEASGDFPPQDDKKNRRARIIGQVYSGIADEINAGKFASAADARKTGQLRAQTAIKESDATQPE